MKNADYQRNKFDREKKEINIVLSVVLALTFPLNYLSALKL